MRYLLAYDIACPKRLRRVARIMERHALRIQKSVFVADMTRESVLGLMEEVAQVISWREDLVQAWRLAVDQPLEGLLRGDGVSLEPKALVHESGKNFFVTK